MYSVALSAAIAVAVSSRSPLEFLKGCVRFGGRPQVVLYLLSPLVTFASLGLFLLLVSPFATLKGLTPIDAAKLLALSYVASVTVNALFALGEEIGWRGLLQSSLEGVLGFRAATLTTGVVWGLWHVPAILVLGYFDPSRSAGGIVGYVAWVTCLALPHAVIFKVSGSLMPAASLHGSINAVWPLAIIAVGGVERGLAALTGGVVYALVATPAIILASRLLGFRWPGRVQHLR